MCVRTIVDVGGGLGLSLGHWRGNISTAAPALANGGQGQAADERRGGDWGCRIGG